MEKEILSLLREERGRYLSGQTISRKLGVSRTMVWKSVEALRVKGFRIGACSSRGYKLEGGPDRMVGLDIEVGLGTRAIGKSVISLDSVPSTIDVASSLANEGSPEGTVVVAESQKGGRGRLGRKWASPPKCGIWTSIILRPSIPPREAPKLTLLTAVSIAKVLTERYNIDARIKWPNDVLVHGRKVCGALTELVAEQDAVRYAIISFGLNVNQTRSKFPAELASTATSMRIEAGRAFDRPEVFRWVLRELDDCYSDFRKRGGDRILNQWRELTCTLGQRVRVQLRDGSIEGIARELDDDGSLIIELDDGKLHQIAYGDVTILR